LICLDRDPQALEIAGKRLREFSERVILVNERFSEIGAVTRNLKVVPINGVMADLGISTLQLDTPQRGFSFRYEGPLDMRMDPDEMRTAGELVNHLPEKELADLIYRFGEERDSRRIARGIVRARPIRDTEHLATVVAGACKARGRQKLHPATKTFLALRIAVNRELEELEQFLSQTPATLAPGARWAVISYHSLEDRMVKRAFQHQQQQGKLRILTKKVVLPSEEEVAANPRARSAKLRVAESVAEWNPEPPEAA
jgi:16S rRNA (cytosine1402-N4)-methyltransferase